LVQRTNHGRFPLFDDVDLSRTVSFISFHFPMFFDIGGTSTAVEVVHAIKQQIRALPHYGIGYGLLRQLSDDQQVVAQLQDQPAPEIFFNYFGQQRRRENGWSRPARESAGSNHDPIQPRHVFLYCRARIADERLSVDWGYSENVHTRATIERLAEAYMDVLRTIMRALSSEDTR
jgi:non-ribosomal peptide synthase protein (TIGR01720 family)